MAHSFFNVYLHIIFSTKERQRWLDDAIRARVHAYIATLARDMGCPFIVVNGPDDHIHILAEMSKTIHPIKMIAKIKQESSKFIKHLGSKYYDFYWQSGYGMFSVSPIHINKVKSYLDSQVEHHRKRTFQDEFRALLDQYGIEYDEKYLWS